MNQSPIAEPTAEEKAERFKKGCELRLNDFRRSMGKLHADCTLDNYGTPHPGQAEVLEALRSYVANLRAEVAAGNGIVLFGPSGTGKDHLLCGVACEAILDGCGVKWINGMRLYGSMRERIGSHESERELLQEYLEPNVLYISDPLPPRGGLTEFQAAGLQQIIDGRLRQRRPLWVSMNVANSKQADELMGASLVDRLKPGSIGAFCDWPSYRKMRMVWPKTDDAPDPSLTR